MQTEQCHRGTTSYWIQMTLVTAFWAFGAAVCVLMLSMSLRGRLSGGATINIAVTLYAAVWMAMVTAYWVAIWKMRELPSGVRFLDLARSAPPLASTARSAWWWTRAAWYGWLVIIGLLTTAIMTVSFAR
jgi:hypothetical protein